MDIYIYSDESGSFDKIHNDYFVFGGILFLNDSEKDICARKYATAEKVIRASSNLDRNSEIKAATINNKSKAKMYRSLNQYEKFAVIIYQKQILDRIFGGKKDKQRYLDYAYKIAVKRKFQMLIDNRIIDAEKVENLYFYVDEHTTATNGCYELRQGLEQEFKNGTYNRDYNKFYEPIFPNVRAVNLQFCNSSVKTLVRAADIIANRVYHMAITGSAEAASDNYTGKNNSSKLFISKLP